MPDPVQHWQDPDGHPFFIGLFARGARAAARLQEWIEEANRLNGPTGLRLYLEPVERHPLGQGTVQGWNAYRIVAAPAGGKKARQEPQTFRRLIRSLESAAP